MADPFTLRPDFSQMNPQPASAPTNDWTRYIPMASGGFSALGAIFNLIQNIQRMQQMAQLRKFYKNWQQAGNQKLSQLVGDAASKGLSGSPNALAGLVASAYAPFQAEAGAGIRSTIAQPAGAVNPFDSFLKSMDALKSAFPSKPSDTGVNFSPNAMRSGGGTGFEMPRGFNMNPSGNPMFDVPSSEME